MRRLLETQFVALQRPPFALDSENRDGHWQFRAPLYDLVKTAIHVMSVYLVAPALLALVAACLALPYGMNRSWPMGVGCACVLLAIYAWIVSRFLPHLHSDRMLDVAPDIVLVRHVRENRSGRAGAWNMQSVRFRIVPIRLYSFYTLTRKFEGWAFVATSQKLRFVLAVDESVDAVRAYASKLPHEFEIEESSELINGLMVARSRTDTSGKVV